MPLLHPARATVVLERLVPLGVWLTTGLLLLLALRVGTARTFTFEPEARPRIVRGLASHWPPWSGPRTELLLHGLDGPARIVLRFKADPALAAKGALVQVSGDGLVVAEKPVSSSYADLAFVLEKGRSRGAWLEPEPLALRCDAYSLSRDRHYAQGVRLESLRVEPLPGPLAGTLVWRCFWLTLLAVFSTWLAGSAAVRFGLGARGRIFCRACAAVLLGAGLLVWARLDPWTLAFWLPPLPMALALAALCVLLRASRGFPSGFGRSHGPGLLALVVAQGLFFFSDKNVLGMGLAVVGLALVNPPSEAVTPGARRPRAGVVLLALFLLALVLRLHRIEEIPFGMWRDEARHGLVALGILEDPSYRPIYVAERNPEINLPGLGFYLLAPGIALFGINPWSMRVVTAVAGGLTVFPVFFLTRRLFGSPTAWLGALFLACSFSHVILSRWAFPTIFDPLLTVAGLALLAWGLEKRAPAYRRGGLALGGLMVGLAAQTYHSGRLAPIVGVCFLLLWERERSRRQESIFAFGVGLGLALLPLLAWAAQHPAEFSARVGEVSLLTQAPLRGEPALTALDQSVLAHLQMFNVRGNLKPLHSLPGHPMLDPVTGLAFLVGAAVAMKRRAEPPFAFLLVALLLGILPSLLALDGPNGMRAVAAIVPACLLAAVGTTTLLHALPGRARLPAVLVLGAVTLGLNAHVYFVRRPVLPQVWGRMYPAEAGMGMFIRSMKTGGAEEPGIYVPKEAAQESVLRFLAHGLEVRTFDSRGEPSSPWKAGDWFLLPAAGTGREGLEALLEHGPRPDHRGPPFPGTAIPSFLGYRARVAGPQVR